MLAEHGNRLESCRLELVPREAGVKVWRVDRVHCIADIARVIQVITGALGAAGHPEKEIYRVHLALEEAVVNAHKHGHTGDWGKPVAVRFHVSADAMVAEVEDQGPGFDPAAVPDPLAPEHLERPTGRGLLLMRTYLSGVCHNQQGNCICLCKHQTGRTPAPQQPVAPSA
jgi:serine/threonine-protein kinase RsbW